MCWYRAFKNGASNISRPVFCYSRSMRSNVWELRREERRRGARRAAVAESHVHGGLFRLSVLTCSAMMLSAVSKAAAGALKAVKPTLLQQESAKIAGVLSVNSEYLFTFTLSVSSCSSCDSSRRATHTPVPPRPHFSLSLFRRLLPLRFIINFVLENSS